MLNNNKIKAFVVAAVAHPYFEVRWLSAPLRKVAEDLFLAEVTRLGESYCRPQASDKADTSEDFYSFSVHESDSEVADSVTLDARLKLFSFRVIRHMNWSS